MASRTKPLSLSLIEVEAVLMALGDAASDRLPPGRPDLQSALVRAKRAMRVVVEECSAPKGNKPPPFPTWKE